MKRILTLFLSLVMVFSLASCGSSKSNETETVEGNKLSADYVIGTWVMNSDISKNSKSAPAFGRICELFKGGTGEGYRDQKMKDSGSCYPLKWEIKDDCLVVSLTADPISVALEIDGDNLTTTDGDFTLTKQE